MERLAMSENRTPPPDRSPKQTREARLAEALRANLRRRKAAQDPKDGQGEGKMTGATVTERDDG